MPFTRVRSCRLRKGPCAWRSSRIARALTVPIPGSSESRASSARFTSIGYRSTTAAAGETVAESTVVCASIEEESAIALARTMGATPVSRDRSGSRKNPIPTPRAMNRRMFLSSRVMEDPRTTCGRSSSVSGIGESLHELDERSKPIPSSLEECAKRRTALERNVGREMGSVRASPQSLSGIRWFAAGASRCLEANGVPEAQQRSPLRFPVSRGELCTAARR